MKTFEDVKLYCFSPGRFLRNRDPVQVVSAEIKGGADVIQFREKQMSRRESLELGFKLRDLTRREGVLFIVNDDIDLALILDADGVHLGQDDIPIRFARPLLKRKIIGISTHTIAQVNEAVASGADYIGFGPVFETDTKEDKEDLVGLELISMVTQICPIPFVAIGGIGKDNIRSLVEAGCCRAAIISDIMLAPDIEERCTILRRILS
ncbi:MAG: thiamine-phosphate diphosphorylase [Desulfobacteraceae bacterium 4484_190.1]|nr:thiamine phosphate synthase [Deltaproteobacteria bacterium]OPX39994.1 MAG: thiamine-phosphate diphosphorylase [Desulfobacteraceae bacterium 4484_190.1]